MPSKTLSSRLADRALALCRVPSPIGCEKDLADLVERWGQEHFAKGQIFRQGNSLVLGSLEDPRPTVALVGHLDTVPPHPDAPPAHIQGDRLFGLGSSDMKGAIAVMMELAQGLDRKSLPENLVLVLYEREEGPYLESGLGPLFEQLPALSKMAFAIAMEPTDNVVQVGCVGSLHAAVRFTGASAHSARPWQGENAIHKAGPLLAELLLRPRREVCVEGYPFYEVLSVTKAQGGRARNVVPDLFELNLNYRFAPGKSVQRAQEELLELIDGRAEVAFSDLAPSGRVCAKNPLFERLLRVSGLPATSKQAWTDVARLSTFGVDAVNFGPGESAQAHQGNESASISALAEAYEKLEQFLQKSEGPPLD